ncbi:MAG: ferredoxin [Chitinispirillaceae bacterium]|jgi:ferredoxin
MRCGLCAGICPEVFTMTDEGKAYVFTESVPKSAVDTCSQSVEQCPVEAINVWD